MQGLQAAGRSGGAVRRAALGRLGPRSALLHVGTGLFQLTHQLLPCRSARRRQSAVLCAGVCGHPVAQVGTGEGADAVASLEGDVSFAGHCRDQRGHLHHPILHQRRGRAAARRVPERPEGHPLPLVGGAHPQPVDAAVPAVAELQRIHAARRLYCAGGRKRELVFYHPETSFFDSADAFPAGALLPSHPAGTKMPSGSRVQLTTITCHFRLFLCHMVASRRCEVNRFCEIVGNLCENAQKIALCPCRRQKNGPGRVRTHRLGPGDPIRFYCGRGILLICPTCRKGR